MFKAFGFTCRPLCYGLFTDTFQKCLALNIPNRSTTFSASTLTDISTAISSHPVSTLHINPHFKSSWPSNYASAALTKLQTLSIQPFSVLTFQLLTVLAPYLLFVLSLQLQITQLFSVVMLKTVTDVNCSQHFHFILLSSLTHQLTLQLF